MLIVKIITFLIFFAEQYVRNSYELWFVKFYSPHCSHCHVVAPTWRELGRELNAVVKVAAVNCEEDWILCRKEGISSYPSFILYPNVNHDNIYYLYLV
jgi:DnaJ family protein C protein 10